MGAIDCGSWEGVEREMPNCMGFTEIPPSPPPRAIYLSLPSKSSPTTSPPTLSSVALP